ncbi:MAG TPA: M48 family metallopeptidase [Bacteroidales bacterium]|nr:M48 family metallopeptidase [Bacteroidales bacterium]
MNKNVTLALIVLIMTSCSSVMLTGRKQLNLVSDAQVLAISDSAYNSFMSASVISGKTIDNARVLRVGTKIKTAVEAYMAQNGLSDQLKGYSWEFKLVKDTSINAFCMPGGKVVVFEGILPVTQTDAGLAVVLGHEIAHAIAKHSNERMSQQMATSSVGTIVASIFQKKSAITQTVANTGFALLTEYGFTLPYSRKQEYEADRLGLIFMAMAGYDPQESINFWNRMAASGSGSVPELMSTHPSNANRIANLKNLIPEALTFYKK